MDDREIVNRREAVAGLSLLSVLGTALVSTVVYRIVTTAPGSPGPARPVSIVEVDPAPYGARATDPGYASALLQPAGSIAPVGWPDAHRMDDAAVAGAESPTGAVQDFENQAMPVTAETPLDEAPRYGTVAPLSETPPFTPLPMTAESPRFVAPAGR